MLTVVYIYACDFCPTTKEERFVAAGVHPEPSLPQGWTAAPQGSVACERHRVVVVDNEARA